VDILYLGTTEPEKQIAEKVYLLWFSYKAFDWHGLPVIEQHRINWSRLPLRLCTQWLLVNEYKFVDNWTWKTQEWEETTNANELSFLQIAPCLITHETSLLLQSSLFLAAKTHPPLDSLPIAPGILHQFCAVEHSHGLYKQAHAITSFIASDYYQALNHCQALTPRKARFATTRSTL